MMIALNRAREEKGFTLMELLLVIGLLSLLLAGVYEMFDGWLQRAVNRQAAADTLRLQQAAEDYTYTNYDTLKSDNVGTFTEIPVADLIAGNFLPSGYTARNSFRQTMRVFKRARQIQKLRSDGTVATDSNGVIILMTTIDVLTISDNPSLAGAVRIPNARLLDAAQAGGPDMGVYSQIVIPGSTFAGRITSPYKDWYLDPAGLNAAGYSATPDTLGGYLASFGMVNGEGIDVNENYLYRVTIDGRPDLNRMEADLYMNSNAIEDAGNMVADKVIVTGNAAFRGITQGAASETSQAMTVDQALRIDGAGETRLNMKTDTGGCGFTAPDGNGNRNVTGPGCNIQGGELQVISANNDARIGVNGSLRTDGSIITDTAFGNAGTQASGISTFQDVDAANLSASGTVISPLTNIKGNQVATQQMQAGSMSVAGVNASGNALQVGGSLVAAAVRPGGANTFTTDNMELGNAATITGNLITPNINVTNALQIGTIDTNPAGGAHAPTNYTDTVLGNRTVRCTYKAANSKTYCEPTGTTSHTWNGGTYLTVCTIDADGYSCNHYVNSVLPANYIGACTYTRDNNPANVKATHTENCVPA